MVKLDCILNGVHFQEPIEWRGLEVLATFEQSAIQPNISLETVTFVNKAAKAVRKWLTDGLIGGPGIFEGMPVQFFISSPYQSVPINIFDGYIDFTQEYKQVSPVKITCKLVKKFGLNTLETRLSALTYGVMNDISNGAAFLQRGDFVTIKTVVIKADQNFEELLLAIVEFNMLRELYFLTLKIATDIANFITSPATLLLDLAYAALLVIQFINLTDKFISALFKVAKNNLAMTYYTALQKACQYLGYEFNTSLSELSTVAYLPSRPDYTELTKGIPNPADFGYRCSEMFEIVLRRCNAKLAVVGKTVQLHQIDAPYWQKSATYPIPTEPPLNVLHEEIVYNTDDYKATRVIAYQTDPTDEWTVKNFTGTNYEIITGPKMRIDPFNVLNKGIEEVNIPMALASSHGTILEGYELLFSQILRDIDEVLKFFGSNKSYSGKVTAYSKAKLKVSSSTWSIPKEVAITQDGYIQRDQKAYISAKLLWSRYHYNKSFLPINPFGQRRMFLEVKIGFGFSDFLKLLNNSYFAGGKGKMISVKWAFDADKAICSWWIHEEYTHNLTETFIEP